MVAIERRSQTYVHTGIEVPCERVPPPPCSRVVEFLRAAADNAVRAVRIGTPPARTEVVREEVAGELDPLHRPCGAPNPLALDELRRLVRPRVVRVMVLPRPGDARRRKGRCVAAARYAAGDYRRGTLWENHVLLNGILVATLPLGRFFFCYCIRVF